MNRANSRGKVINIVNEESDAVFQILSSRKAMRFKALGTDSGEDNIDAIRLVEIQDQSIDADRIHDAFL